MFLTMVSALLGGGVLAFVQFLINRYDKKQAKTSNIMIRLDNIDNALKAVEDVLQKQIQFNRAAGADRVVCLGKKYIERGYIGYNEWAIYRAEFEAYEKIGGNGTARVIFDEVVALERIDDKDIYQYEKENEK